MTNSTQNMSAMDEEPQHDEQSKINIRLLTADQRKVAVNMYRQVYDGVKKIESNEVDFKDMLLKLTSSVNDQNQTLQRVGVNELMPMDARCMSMSSQLSYNLVKKFHTESKFDKKEFIRRLRQRVIKNASKSGMRLPNVDPTEGNRCIRFEQLAATGFAYSNMHHLVPMITRTFRAPLEKATPTQTNERKRTQRTPTTQTTQPTQYDSSNMANNLDESEKRLMYIHKQMWKLEKINPEKNVPLMQAAVNPKNYGLTIENFFNIAFLARQAKISLEMPECTDAVEPLVRTFQDENEKNPNAPGTSFKDAQEQEKERGVDPSRKSVQSIMSFDYETFQQLIKSMGITRSAIN